MIIDGVSIGMIIWGVGGYSIVGVCTDYPVYNAAIVSWCGQSVVLGLVVSLGSEPFQILLGCYLSSFNSFQS